MMVGVDRSRFEPVVEVSVGVWIAPRLGPFGGRVGSVAPRGYAHYARVLHPVPDRGDAARPAIRWADVCAAMGRQPHALMQWHAIACVVETRIRRTVTCTMAWPGEEPEVGNLERAPLRTLCRVLTGHTAPDQDCFVALWEGYGWAARQPSRRHAGQQHAACSPSPPSRPGRSTRTTLSHPTETLSTPEQSAASQG